MARTRDYPIVTEAPTSVHADYPQVLLNHIDSEGKTLRESYAESALQGLLANRSVDVNYPDKMLTILSKVAVMAADALIKELNKEVDDKKKVV